MDIRNSLEYGEDQSLFDEEQEELERRIHEQQEQQEEQAITALSTSSCEDSMHS